MPMKPKLAEALYENIAESQDELEFRVGDIVTVLELDTSGLDGWWLCQLNNKQGIAPGNRLQLIPSHSDEEEVYDTPPNNSLSAQKLPWAEDDEYDVPTHNYSVNLSNNNNNEHDPSEVYDVPTTRKNWVSPLGNSSYSSPGQNPEEIYDVPTHNNSVMSPNSSANDEDIYDVPTNKSALDLSNFSTIEVDDVYDVPPRATPANFPHQLEEDDEYDIPLSNKLATENLQTNANPGLWNASAFSMISVQDELDSDDDDVVYDIPSSRYADNLPTSATQQELVSAFQEDFDSVYDVPPKHEIIQRSDSLSSLEKMINRLSTANDRKSDSSIDSCTSSIVSKAIQYEELILDATVASDYLIKKNQQIEDSVSHLLTLVHEGWRTRSNLSAKLNDVKQTFSEVLAAVKIFLEFARGCFANGNNAKSRTVNNVQPKHLVSGLYKLLMPIEEDYGMLERANLALDKMKWNVDEIIKTQEKHDGIPDDVDSFIMTSRAVSDDAAQMSTYIHTHMQYLFSNDPTLVPKIEINPATPNTSLNQSRPLPDVPRTKKNSSNYLSPKKVEVTETWLEDYDYVSLEDSMDANISYNDSPIHHSHESKVVDEKCKKVLEKLEHANHSSGLPFVRVSIDNHVSQNYINEMVNDVPIIVNALHIAVKKFYRSIEQHDPPKLFVGLSKQVVLCAHELVFFGDMLYKFLPKGSMQEQVKGHCTQLCSALKQTVTSTKLAALNWPANGNIKDLVSKVSNITQQSYQFRIMLSNCSVR